MIYENNLILYSNIKKIINKGVVIILIITIY